MANSYPSRAGLYPMYAPSAAASASSTAATPAPSPSPYSPSAEEEKRRLGDVHAQAHAHEKEHFRYEHPNDLQVRSGLAQSHSHAVNMAAGPSSSFRTRQPSSSEEKPASRGMVVFSVLFYLVAALVMVS